MRLFKIALPCLFAAGLALFAARAFTDRTDKLDRALAVEHARGHFAQEAALVRAAPNADAYHAELRALLAGWFAQQSALGNRWPLLRHEPAPFVPPPPHAKNGSLHEWQELADATVGAWREGRLDLYQTATDAGLRLDLLKVARTPGKAAHLAVDVAVWGAPEEFESDDADASGKASQRALVPLSFRGLSLRFYDSDGRLIAEMPGQGEPALRLDLPERLVHDAPPGLVLGRYEPALFPREAAEAEWTLAVQLRTPSGELRAAQGVWRAKVDPAWTIAAGESWGGADRTGSAGAENAREVDSAANEVAGKPGAKAAGGTANVVVWPARAENNF